MILTERITDLPGNDYLLVKEQNNVIYTTRYIPKDACILLVDPDCFFIDEATAYLKDDEMQIKEAVYQHAAAIVETVRLLKAKGHEIAMTHAIQPFPGLEPLVDVHLPNWEVKSNADTEFQLHPEIIKYAAGKTIIVGGVWKQLCVFHVSRLLQQQYMDEVRLFNGDLLKIPYEYTMTSEDISDDYTLKDACEEYGMMMKLI